MSVDVCVACGEVVPEGTMVCKNCIEESKSTCYGCENRTIEPNCHDSCKRHRIRTKVNEAISKKKRVRADADNFLRDNIAKVVRKKHQRGQIRKGMDA